MTDMSDNDFHDYINFEYYLQNMGLSKPLRSSARETHCEDTVEISSHLNHVDDDGTAATTERSAVGEEFQDDFTSETDEDEYCVDWKVDGAVSDAVDTHQCTLFAIAEERSPDVVRETYEQSWTDTQNDRKLTVTTDEVGEHPEQHMLEPDQFRCQWTPDEERKLNRKVPRSAEINFENELRDGSGPDTDDLLRFDGEDPNTMLNYTETSSFSMNGPSMCFDNCVENRSRQHDKLADERGVGDSNQTLSDWNVDRQVGAGLGETFQEKKNRERVVEWEEELTYNGITAEMEDDISDRCEWHSDFISSQADTWLRQPDQDFTRYHRDTSVKDSLAVEMNERPGSELYAPNGEIDDSSGSQDRDPHSWNENCEESTTFALPTSPGDVHVGGREHETMCKDDNSQGRVVGRRWENKPAAATVDAIQTSRHHETDQSATEQDTLPRRGHMKTLLAQWREMEQRRKDEELIQITAATSSDRSRRTAVRAAWFKTPEQQGGFTAAMRSQSCGPVSRRPANVEEFDSSSRRRNGSVGDAEEPEMVFDRLAIKEKFERLDAEAQRTTIINRKKQFKWNVKEPVSLGRLVTLRTAS